MKSKRSTPARMKLMAGTALCGLVLGAMLVASSPARAADEGEPIDTQILRKLLEGIGLQRDGGSSIDYHERAPLVIPPDKDLPAPEASDAAARNPAWPKDPDIERRKQEAAIARRGTTSQEIEDWSRPLRPDQLTPNGNPRARAPRVKTSTPLGAEGTLLSPSELGYKGGLFGNIFGNDEETARFTGEPARTSLTDPPPGYQTPSPDQPYGSSKADSAPKAMDATEQRIKGAEK